MSSSLSQFFGLAIGMCATVGGCVIDNISEVATVHSSLSQFFGLSIGMCATVVGCVINKISDAPTVNSSLSQFLGQAIGICAKSAAVLLTSSPKWLPVSILRPGYRHVHDDRRLCF